MFFQQFLTVSKEKRTGGETKQPSMSLVNFGGKYVFPTFLWFPLKRTNKKNRSLSLSFFLTPPQETTSTDYKKTKTTKINNCVLLTRFTGLLHD